MKKRESVIAPKREANLPLTVDEACALANSLAFVAEATKDSYPMERAGWEFLCRVFRFVESEWSVDEMIAADRRLATLDTSKSFEESRYGNNR